MSDRIRAWLARVIVYTARIICQFSVFLSDFNFKELGELFVALKYYGVKFHDLIQVGEKICCAMIAGIEMIFVFERFRLKLAVQGFGSVFESVFVVTSAIEINR